MIGLGTMGCNLLLNIADHGFSGAGYDKNPDKVSMLNQLGRSKNVKGFDDINRFYTKPGKSEDSDDVGTCR